MFYRVCSTLWNTLQSLMVRVEFVNERNMETLLCDISLQQRHRVFQTSWNESPQQDSSKQSCFASESQATKVYQDPGIQGKIATDCQVVFESCESTSQVLPTRPSSTCCHISPRPSRLGKRRGCVVFQCLEVMKLKVWKSRSILPWIPLYLCLGPERIWMPVMRLFHVAHLCAYFFHNLLQVHPRKGCTVCWARNLRWNHGCQWCLPSWSTARKLSIRKSKMHLLDCFSDGFTSWLFHQCKQRQPVPKFCRYDLLSYRRGQPAINRNV